MITPWNAFRNLDTIIDIRPSGEFTQGHIPKAISVPAEIDLRELKSLPSHTHLSRDQLQSFFHNWEEFCSHLSSTSNARIGVYCARGGMRSAVVQRLWNLPVPLHVLEGGYEAFRSSLGKTFYFPWRLVRIAGKTGVGKTDVLQALSEMGCQTINLEEMGKHRGSVFGSHKVDQPPQHLFELQLSERLHACKSTEVIFIEQKGKHLGGLHLPEPFDTRVFSSPYIEILADRKDRLERLVNTYGRLPAQQIEENIYRLEDRITSEHRDAALKALHDGKLMECANVLLKYYDKSQLYLEREGEKLFEVVHTNTAECANRIHQRISTHFPEDKE